MQPSKTPRKIVARSDFNVCGEASTASTSYTGVQPRRFCELPRMSYDAKAAILGSSAAGEVDKLAVQKDIELRGHPFSHCEMKPIGFWQRRMEHFGVTHIVVILPESAALAVAAAGTQECEGVASCEEHRERLDQIMDRCTTLMAVEDKAFLEALGSDLAFTEATHKHFAGRTMDARRHFEHFKGGECDAALLKDPPQCCALCWLLGQRTQQSAQRF